MTKILTFQSQAVTQEKSQKGAVQRAKCGDLCSVTGHAQVGAATTQKLLISNLISSVPFILLTLLFYAAKSFFFKSAYS